MPVLMEVPVLGEDAERRVLRHLLHLVAVDHPVDRHPLGVGRVLGQVVEPEEGATRTTSHRRQMKNKRPIKTPPQKNGPPSHTAHQKR